MKMEASMDRREFIKIVLTTSLVSPIIINQKSGQPHSELFLISAEPHKDLPFLLSELEHLSLPVGRRIGFAGPHPQQKELASSLKDIGMNLVPERKAEVLINFVYLTASARPSFTLIQEGRIRDLRSSRLFSFWKQMQARPETRSLTILSLTPSFASLQKGKNLAIRIDGKVVERLPLAQSVRRTIDTGFGRVVFKVENGQAWVEDSTCRHHICQASTPIKFAGERIICAPNHFLMEIEGRSGLDAVIG
jgi:hypothetical protein